MCSYAGGKEESVETYAWRSAQTIELTRFDIDSVCELVKTAIPGNMTCRCASDSEWEELRVSSLVQRLLGVKLKRTRKKKPNVTLPDQKCESLAFECARPRVGRREIGNVSSHYAKWTCSPLESRAVKKPRTIQGAECRRHRYRRANKHRTPDGAANHSVQVVQHGNQATLTQRNRRPSGAVEHPKPLRFSVALARLTKLWEGAGCFPAPKASWSSKTDNSKPVMQDDSMSSVMGESVGAQSSLRQGQLVQLPEGRKGSRFAAPALRLIVHSDIRSVDTVRER
ncbi:hypothetical protein C8F01DRAFT_1077624 [Mycena amicta]|nr:hypothetical protein C8F01DRAFT_1077624 [Mycena amicta]